uniref:Secreted protein n=1 Tax=Ixodes ricinus TaxID=34613 RepID=A0A147BDT8_IXORI
MTWQNMIGVLALFSVASCRHVRRQGDVPPGADCSFKGGKDPEAFGRPSVARVGFGLGARQAQVNVIKRSHRRHCGFAEEGRSGGICLIQLDELHHFFFSLSLSLLFLFFFFLISYGSEETSEKSRQGHFLLCRTGGGEAVAGVGPKGFFLCPIEFDSVRASRPRVSFFFFPPSCLFLTCTFGTQYSMSEAHLFWN